MSISISGKWRISQGLSIIKWAIWRKFFVVNWLYFIHKSGSFSESFYRNIPAKIEIQWMQVCQVGRGDNGPAEILADDAKSPVSHKCIICKYIYAYVAGVNPLARYLHI